MDKFAYFIGGPMDLTKRRIDKFIPQFYFPVMGDLSAYKEEKVEKDMIPLIRTVEYICVNLPIR